MCEENGFQGGGSAGPLRTGDKDFFERYESDSIGIVRSRLKLPSYRSVNAQRHIWARTSLIGRNLLPCKLIGRAVYLDSSPDRALVARWHSLVRRQCFLELLEQPLIWGIIAEPFLASPDQRFLSWSQARHRHHLADARRSRRGAAWDPRCCLRASHRL